MQVTPCSHGAVIANFNYRLEVRKDRLALLDPRTGHVLLETTTPLIYRPEFHGNPVTWTCTSLEVMPAAAGPVTVQVTGVADSANCGPLTVELRCWPDHIEIAAQTPVTQPATIAYWNLLEPGIFLNLFHVHHWRNRHGHTATVETYNLYQGGKTAAELASPGFPAEIVRNWTTEIDITTYSYDWQYAPRPSLLLFQRDSVMLGLGSRDLPQGFGLELKAAAQKLDHLRLNYGGEHGLKLSQGQTTQAPRMYLWLDHHGDIWNSVDHYVSLLRDDGMIPHRSQQDVPHWWLRPTYCTWNDQGYLSGNAAYYNWPGDQPTGKDPVTAFDAAMLDHLVTILEREKYNFGTVIIDDGWQKARGEWRAHPTKFPNLRSQIDRIHRLGMKVLMWIAPFDFHDGCELRNHPEWLCGNGVLGRHGMPLADFSHPQVQEDYVKPFLRYLFSADPDCLDADGIKTDFMADKIHPIFPVHDPDWRGEERFILKTLQMWYDGTRQYKPDAQLLGSTVHPFFIPCQDLIRTYDVPVSQFQHTDRAVMIRHFNPGNLPALDLGETKSLADVEQHLALAYEHNLLYECGRIAPDPATGQFPAGPDYVALLKRKLLAWG